MERWTPEMRNAFINDAIHSTEQCGERGVYRYRVFTDNGDAANQPEDPRRTTVTRVLSEVIFNHGRKLALGAYEHLLQKLYNNPVIGSHIFRDVIVLLKGSNAHIYFNNRTVDEIFKVSDSDIVVCIRPDLPRDVFDMLKHQVEISVRQAISQYKRTLDQLLFLGGSDSDAHMPFMTQQEVVELKNEINRAFQTIEFMDNGDRIDGVFLSPFMDTETRNKCSRYSFLITKSQVSENNVMVHLPHYDHCERIPLRKTPLFVSINETLDFDRNDEGSRGKFTLHRMKLNVLHSWMDIEIGMIREDKIPADFVDISVPDKDDVELQHFWQKGMYVSVYEPCINMWVAIPDLPTCISELQRILELYNNVEQKREKRIRKLQALQSIYAATVGQ